MEEKKYKAYTCKKMGWPSKDLAEKYIWRKRISPDTTNSFRVTRSYKCPFCTSYHLTSSPKE